MFVSLTKMCDVSENNTGSMPHILHHSFWILFGYYLWTQWTQVGVRLVTKADITIELQIFV